MHESQHCTVHAGAEGALTCRPLKASVREEMHTEIATSYFAYLLSKEEEAKNNKPLEGVPVMAQWLRNLALVRFLASFSGLRIRCCHELWCGSQI